MPIIFLNFLRHMLKDANDASQMPFFTAYWVASIAWGSNSIAGYDQEKFWQNLLLEMKRVMGQGNNLELVLRNIESVFIFICFLFNFLFRAIINKLLRLSTHPNIQKLLVRVVLSYHSILNKLIRTNLNDIWKDFFGTDMMMEHFIEKDPKDARKKEGVINAITSFLIVCNYCCCFCIILFQNYLIVLRNQSYPRRERQIQIKHPSKLP